MAGVPSDDGFVTAGMRALNLPSRRHQRTVVVVVVDNFAPNDEKYLEKQCGINLSCIIINGEVVAYK